MLPFRIKTISRRSFTRNDFAIRCIVESKICNENKEHDQPKEYNEEIESVNNHVANEEIESIHDHVAKEKIERINDHVATEKIESINDHGAKKVESIETNTKHENSSKKVKSTCKRFCCDPNHIGLLINKAMTDVEKYALISNVWKPDSNFDFPFHVESKDTGDFKVCI